MSPAKPPLYFLQASCRQNSTSCFYKYGRSSIILFICTSYNPKTTTEHNRLGKGGTRLFELSEKQAQEIVDKMMMDIPYNINIMNGKGVIIGSGKKERVGTIHKGSQSTVHRKNGRGLGGWTL